MNRQNNVVASYHMIFPSQATAIKMHRLIEKMIESRVNGNQSSLTALTVAKAPTAATPRVLNSIEPRIAPTPMSELVTNVLMTFVKSSGVVVAIDMKVAAATSCHKNYLPKDSFRMELIIYL